MCRTCVCACACVCVSPCHRSIPRVEWQGLLDFFQAKKLRVERLRETQAGQSNRAAIDFDEDDRELHTYTHTHTHTQEPDSDTHTCLRVYSHTSSSMCLMCVCICVCHVAINRMGGGEDDDDDEDVCLLLVSLSVFWPFGPPILLEGTLPCSARKRASIDVCLCVMRVCVCSNQSYGRW